MATNNTATARLAARYIPKDARCILEHVNGSACYVYEVAGKFYAIGFWGTSAKSMFHYSYRTEEQRNQAIWNFRESVEHSIEHRAKAKAERAKPHTFKVGDIVNTSWGYDQTNVDFFVITRTSAACVWVRPIAQDAEAIGYMQERCWPKMPIEMTGPETRHVANAYGFSINGHGASLTTKDCYSSSYA